jgi:methionyl-tRNA formyltransferase
MDRKKIVFCGYGPLALACLKSIVNEFNVAFVFTYLGEENNPLLSFLVDEEIGYSIHKPNVDNQQNPFPKGILISVNYKYILNMDFVELFDHAINLHGSLLPKYRGRSPHIWAIINGEKFSGVTAHRIREMVDTGNILVQKVVPIDPDESGASLLKKFERLYPEVVMEALGLVENFNGYPQNEDEATYFGKRTESMSYIDTKNTNSEVINFIRALRKPYPCAYYYLSDGRRINIELVKVSQDVKKPNHNGIFSLNGKFYLATKDGVLEIIEYELSK